MVKKFSGSQDITLTPKSKSTTWKYTGGKAPYVFNVDTESSSEYEYDDKTFATRSKDDLVLTTVFSTLNGKIKKITNTIKNYFADTSAEYTVNYSTRYNWHAGYTNTILPNTPEGAWGLYGSEISGESEFILAQTGKHPAEILITETLGGFHIYNTSGNNKYKNTSTYENFVHDMAGTDKYETQNKGTLWVYDYAGRDEYNAANEATLWAYDYAGKDDYSMMSDVHFDITDYAGNDNYSVLAANDDLGEGEKRIIYDMKGNDTYFFGASSVEVSDGAGKDKYDIYNGSKVLLDDGGKGNDTYEIELCSGMNYGLNQDFRIYNEKGNETYNIHSLDFTSVPDTGEYEFAIGDTYGNDKYNLKRTKDTDVKVKNVSTIDSYGNDKYTATLDNDAGIIDNVTFVDNSGNDTYTLKGFELTNTVKTVTIIDEEQGTAKGKDKYNFTAVEDFEIFDEKGNDTYKLVYSTGYVEDDEGSDKYTVKAVTNGGVSIHDYQKQNDTYSVDISGASDSCVYIDDAGGNKDSLTLSNIKNDRLVLMADVKSDGTYLTDSLYIYDKTSRNTVILADFYKENESGSFTGFGDGRIETIKAGKTVIREAQTENLYKFFEGVKSEVGAWLATTDYGSVEAVMDSDDVGAKNQLVAYFTQE